MQLVSKTEKVKLTTDSYRKAKGIFSYLKPYAFVYFIGWVFLVLSTSAGLVFPYLMGKLLGASGSKNTSSGTIDFISMENISSIALSLFILFAFQALFSFVRVVIFNNVTENALRDIRNDAFEKLVYMPMDFFNKSKVGELTSRVSSDIVQLQDTLRTTIAEFFRQIIIVFGGIAFLFFISWKLALIMLATVPVMAIVAVFFGRFIRKLSKEAQNFTAESNSIIEEALTGITNVKSFTNEMFTLSKYKTSTQQTRDLNVRSGIWRGLFVSFIISIEDVTSSLLKNITSSLTEKERQTAIEKNIADLKKSYKKESYQDIIIKPFFDGNKYYLFVTETYKDVRLVGAPPSSIGNFGKDSDNWMWPRHTGDFSMFRIYADKNNKPAEYSPDNVPYKPKKSLSISLKGLKEGDFTMVFGFPGRTNEYLTSYAVKQIVNTSDPLKIDIRRTVLETMGSFMRKDEGIKIKYAAKYASVENAYKKWQGEVLGLTKSNGVQKKIDFENSLRDKISNNKDYMIAYGNLLEEMSSAYSEIEPYAFNRDCYTEIMPRIEIFNVCAALNTFINNTIAN